MKYPNGTAFIVSNPQSVAGIFQEKPPLFHVFLVGENNVTHPNITACSNSNMHNTAVVICREMLRRRLSHIVSDDASRPLEQKVSELIGSSCSFALSGAIQNALANLWHNLPFLAGSRSIDSIRGTFESMPCILVASGPSLEKNVHLLNDLKSRALLISCGSALGPLRRRGIAPHFEIVVDPNPAMYETLKPHLNSPTCFVLSLMTQHRISQESSAERMYFLVNSGTAVVEDLKRFTGIQTVLPAMASVATTALFFALHAGCNPIIFVGQDLCYPDDRTHIDGSVLSNGGVTLQTLDGRHVRSSPAMKEAFDFYADFLPGLKSRTIINATEGGAGIRGAEHLTLSETAARHLNRVIAVPELPVLNTAAARWRTRLNELRNRFNSMHLKAAGFDRKIRQQLDAGKDKTAVASKIAPWFDSFRTMAGYEYLAGYLDWAFYKSDTADEADAKVELLAATGEILRQQIRQINDTLKT